MGKADRLRNRVEPFTVLFLVLGIVLTNTLASLPDHCNAVHKACPYMVIVGKIVNEDALRYFVF